MFLAQVSDLTEPSEAVTTVVVQVWVNDVVITK